MSSLRPALLALAATLALAPAAAAQQRDPERLADLRQRLIEHFDANGDGTLDDAERGAVRDVARRLHDLRDARLERGRRALGAEPLPRHRTPSLGPHVTRPWLGRDAQGIERAPGPWETLRPGPRHGLRGHGLRGHGLRGHGTARGQGPGAGRLHERLEFLAPRGLRGGGAAVPPVPPAGARGPGRDARDA